MIEHGKTYGTARTELASARDATMFEKCMVISSVRMLDVRREMFQRLSARYIYCGSFEYASAMHTSAHQPGWRTCFSRPHNPVHTPSRFEPWNDRDYDQTVSDRGWKHVRDRALAHDEHDALCRIPDMISPSRTRAPPILLAGISPSDNSYVDSRTLRNKAN